MSNYRIRVELLNPEVELPEEMKEGIYADGFCLYSDNEDTGTISVQHMTTLDMAKGIALHPMLRAASRLAEGLIEARKIEREGKAESLMDKLRIALGDGKD